MATRERASCPYCGEASVSHVFQFVSSTLEVMTSAFVPRVSGKTPRLLNFERSPILRFLGGILLRGLKALGAARTSKELHEKASKRTKVVWQEAKRRGIEVEELIIFGKQLEECRAWLPRRRGGARRRWHHFQSLPIPPWLPGALDSWVDDKQLFKRRFLKQGLPVAKGRSSMTLEKGLRVFRALNRPVIVKPRNGSRARHTSVNVSLEKDFVAAFARARQLCAFVMIEEYIPGDTYRATCVAGKFVAAMKFVKPCIVADGRSSCEELRAHYNEGERPPGVEPVKNDAVFRLALSHQGYGPDSIPSRGEPLTLAEHSERANGGYNLDVTDSVPEETVALIERAARVSRLPVIGFDLISKDLEDRAQPVTFIEGNSLPFIDIHHDPTLGTPRDVAGAVWDLWFPTARAS